MTVGREKTATGSAPERMYVASRRFLYDYGHQTGRQIAFGKAQGVYRVGHCAAAAVPCASRMWQEDRGTTDAPQQLDNGMGVEVACP